MVSVFVARLLLAGAAPVLKVEAPRQVAHGLSATLLGVWALMQVGSSNLVYWWSLTAPARMSETAEVLVFARGRLCAALVTYAETVWVLAVVILAFEVWWLMVI